MLIGQGKKGEFLGGFKLTLCTERCFPSTTLVSPWGPTSSIGSTVIVRHANFVRGNE